MGPLIPAGAHCRTLSMMTTNHDRWARTLLSLDGLSVGDAFGERFFTNPAFVDDLILHRAVPPGTWTWTDDTAMALSVVETLGSCGDVDEDDLAGRFARRYLAEPGRGYGGGAHRLLSALAEGAGWKSTAGDLFGGTGSYGNGAAMRAPPIGAFFEGDPARAALAADKSARVTHAHIEGRAGAIAIAVAASVAARSIGAPDALFDAALIHTPHSDTRDGIARAAALGLDTSVAQAARLLGSGADVSAMDTVPFCVWCAARHLDNYLEALWTTVAGLGDRDTTCAIVGGVVALSSSSPIPDDWRRQRETLPPLAAAG